MEQTIEVKQTTTAVKSPKVQADRLRKKIKEIAKSIDSQYLEFGRALWDVHEMRVDGDPANPPIFTLWGFKTFAEYAEGELGLHRRKAERLRSIWHTISVELKDIPEEHRDRLINLGQSKLRELVRVLTPGNAEYWCDLAEKSSVAQLVGLVKTAVDKQQLENATAKAGKISTDGVPFPGAEGAFELGGPKPKDPDIYADHNPFVDDAGKIVEAPTGPVPNESKFAEGNGAPVSTEETEMLHFALYPAQMVTVMRALEKAKAMTGSHAKGHNLSMIATDFMATSAYSGAERTSENLALYLSQMEKTLGIRILAVDERSRDLVYGARLLQALNDGEA